MPRRLIIALGAPGSGLTLLTQCLRILGLSFLNVSGQTGSANINVLYFVNQAIRGKWYGL